MSKQGDIALRDALAEELLTMSQTDPAIVVLDADLSASSGLSAFADHQPDRFFNCGIQEANMIGVAGGLSSMGFKPFTHTFAAFASRRVADQAYVSSLYSGQNVKMISSDPGILNGANGGTHLSYEDLGIYMAYPDIHIVDFTDAVMLKKLLPEIIATTSTFYLRLFRKTKVRIYEESEEFRLGQAKILKAGSDVVLFAAGALSVPDALETAELLAEKGITATVVDLVSIKPLDRELILREAEKTRLTVVFDNHYKVNGIGSEILSLMNEAGVEKPLLKIGIPQVYGEVGTVEYLKEKYGMAPYQVSLAITERLGE